MKKIPFSNIFFTIFLTSVAIAIPITALAVSPSPEKTNSAIFAAWALNTIIGIISLLLGILLPNKHFQSELIIPDENKNPD
jgi:hypothetical protein